VKSPLNGGFLTGKFTVDTTFPDYDSRQGLDFREGRYAERLRQVEALRPILTEDGRSMTQGALAWILTRSPNTISIPGFKTAGQVEENVSSLDSGPLSDEQMLRVEEVMGRVERTNV
jgi:aryl-alcohol dehydrogenase-like predicted oxidoreductase